LPILISRKTGRSSIG